LCYTLGRGRAKERGCDLKPAVWQFAAIVVLGVAACCAQTQLSGPLASKSVLILDSHEFGTSASAEIDQGLLAALHNAGVSNGGLYFEFLDLRRYPDPGYRDSLTALLRLKYESKKLDLVVAVSPPALSVVLEDPRGRRPLFEGVPVIGVAVQENLTPSTKEHPLILVTDDLDVRGTVKTALDLLPKTEHMVVVSGVSEQNKLAEFQAKRALREWADRLDISWLSDLPLDKMLRTVSEAPPHSFILYLGVKTDVAGSIYIPSEVAEAVSRVSAAPVFGVADTHIRLGLVGGLVKDYAEEGREAGRVAVRILKGELTLLPALPPIRSPNLPLFDWRQMKRWGLDETRLPKGSVVENRPATIWSQHPWYVIGAGTFAVLESLLIGALLLDVRRRVRVQEELRGSQALLRGILDGAPDPIFLKDREGRMVMANPATLRVIGEPAEQVLGKTNREYLDDPEARRALLENDLRVLETGVAQTVEETVPGPEGPRVFLSTKSPYFDAEGRVIGIIGVSRDITERNRAESEKARLQLQLAQAQKMESIGRLAGGVAHDFNNLLTVINGYSQLLLGNLKAGDPLRGGLNEIHKAGNRAAGLTRQLLAFSRKQILQPRVLDLDRVVGEMRPMLARLMGEDVEVCVQLQAEAATICADPHQLEQALMNLAVNSRDAMPRGGRFSIETGLVEWGESDVRLRPGAQAGSYVMLAVSDTGEGMSEETRGHIFEPFFTTKVVGKGTGLGLSTIHGIVEQSGGYVEVDSQVGRGATFKIYLPRVVEAPAESGRPEAIPEMGGQGTVLVVEDQPEVRGYAAAALRAFGYQVMEAADAAEALLVCEREGERIDLILTDVVMPGLSGRELADRLKTLRPGIKVLFMSGYTDDTIVQHGVLRREAEFIQKPFSPDELAIKVREVLMPPGRAPVTM
jgi:PAS domain S-box-containing protein